MTDLVDPESYAKAWPGKPENAAAEARERSQRFHIDEPPDTPLPGFEPPDETSEAYSEPPDGDVSLEASMARALLDAAADSEPGTRAEVLQAAQVWATLELARAMRVATPNKPAHAWRVSRETGQLEDMGPVS